ncbi:Ppx/GppA phosphatase family protein [uncultured Chloroflexus sp.]|uniref:Ppx/GppA phosphatase family protein n=1 Tax=uncultured Chloroflexus sp. TaxID=214040 RepID=UPI002632838B|nr:Ppx/GppA phosphatase family protein [uncultured Chloroflexus sp.]
MKKIGVIDLGSNTTRLIVMAYEPGYSFRLTDEVSETVRLAEGIGPSRMLQPVPIRRAVEALRMFYSLCLSTGVDQVIAVGTSAIREAANQAEFWAALRAATPLDLRIISAEEEAYFGYLGAINALPLQTGALFDTGGGSTQVMAVYDRSLTRSFSVQAGVVRFTEQFVQSDPISRADLRRLREAARAAFAPLDWLPDLHHGKLGGMGGTVRQLARIDQKQRNYPLERVHGYVLTREALERMIDELARRPRRERLQIPGMKEERVDVTLAGAVIIATLMDRGGFSSLLVSGQGVREGIFYQHFLADQPQPLLANPRRFSVLNLARLTHYEPEHCARVAHLSQSLFDQLAPLHGYGAWERELLGYAAILHDVGVSVGYYDHHKHGEYLIHNATLLGFSHREIVIIASLVRNHRKGWSGPAPYAAIVTPDDETRIARLSAMLRLAEYLERSKSQIVRDVRVQIGEAITIDIIADGDAHVEIWEATRRSGLLRRSFGREVQIRAA